MAIFSGAESVVNLPDGGVQQNARLARGANGGWIAAWQSGEGGTDGFGVFLRLFDANGLGGPEIHVNQKTAANQGEISVTMLGDGGFLVTWTDMDYAASGGWDIYQRRYDASGTPLTGEMPVNLTTSDMQASPDVIATPDGGWIVAWTSSGQAGPNRDIFMRRFDSTGADMTGEVLVNTSTLDFNDTPKTTLLASGGWVISWQRMTATGTALFQRQFDSAGIPAGPEAVVDSMPGGQDERPATAGLADGGWIVAWAAFGVDGSGWSVCQRRYDADGNAVPTTPLLVNTHTVDDQRNPAIASLPNGGWVVVWQSENQDESSFLSSSGIYQQVFDQNGNPVGGEMLVNSQIVGNQANPTVTTLDDGAWIVSWQDDSVGGTDIIQKKFEPIHAAPEGQDKSIDIAAGDSHAFSASDFAFTDGDGDALLSIVMTGFVGNLLLDGQAVAIGATINAADLDKMVWDANGGPGGSISFKVIDNGSTAHGGVNMDDDANTITFNVIAATAAIFGGDLAGTVSEDESTVISGTATVTDPDPGENAFLAVQAGALNGSHGVFTFDDASGQWSYDLNEADKSIQVLGDTDSVTDTLALASADGTTTSLVITINGVNDAAVFSGTLAQTINEDETAIAGGQIAASDPDSGQSGFVAASEGDLTGAFGNFTFTAFSGQWTFDLNETNPDIQALKEGEIILQSLTVSSVDGTTAEIVVTINGANDAAVISGDLAGEIGEDEAAIIGGIASVSDADSGESLFVAVPAGALVGAHGAFTFNEVSGEWTYDLDEADAAIQALKAGEALTDSLQIASLDGTTAEIVVTIDGVNDAAIISGDLAAVLGEDESGTIGGTASVADGDSGESLFLAVPAGTLIGVHGAFTFNEASGQWTYDLDESDAAIQALKAGETITDSLQIASADSTTAEIVVTIDGVDDAAVLTGDLAAVLGEDESGIIGGAVSVVDADSGESAFMAVPADTLIGAHGAFTFNEASGQWTYDLDESDAAIQALKAGEALTDSLQIASLDGTTAEIVVTIDGAADAAVAGGALSAVTVEDASGPVGGAIIVVDPDAGESTIVSVKSGLHGAFTINALTGQWSYDLDNEDDAVQSLGDGDILTDIMQVETVDGTVIDISVSITGTNDSAATGGFAAADVIEDLAVNASGLLTITDPDQGQAGWQSPADLTGDFGAFTFDLVSGAWTYTLDNARPDIQALGQGQNLVDILTVTSLDGTAQSQITVTIAGADEPPAAAVISGTMSATLSEDATGMAFGTLAVTDPDAGQEAFAAVPLAQLAGAHGTFTFAENSGQWSYDLDETAAGTQAMKAGESLTDTLQITSLDGTKAEIVITINGLNDTAHIAGLMAATIGEDEAAMAGGLATVNDADAGESAFLAVPATAGAHGTFTFNTLNGQWSYDLDQADGTIQSLKAGESLDDTLQITSLDGTTAEIVVTINGANDAALIDGDMGAEIGEDGATIVGGVLSVSDVDMGESAFLAVTAAALAGAHGVFTFNEASGQWSYDLDESDAAIQSLKTGETLTDALVIASVDGTTAEIVVTINGTNDAAVLAGDLAANIGEDESAIIGGTASANDADSGESAFLAVTAAQLAGAHGVFTFNALNGQWSYDLDESDAAIQSLKTGETLTDALAIASVDGTTAEIVVTINGANDVAVITGDLAADIGEDEATIVGGFLAVSDADAGESLFLAVPETALVGVHGTFTFDDANGEWSYDLDEADTAIQSLRPGESLTDTLQVTSTDGTTAEILVTVNGANDAAALAGDLMADVGEDESAIIGGTASVVDPDGGESLFLAVPAGALAGDHGIFTFDDANGQWSYDLDEADPAIQSLKAGESLADTLQVATIDGTKADIVVTISGANDTAVITGDLAADIGEDEATIVGGFLTVSDADSGESAFLAVTAGALDGAHGAFTFNETNGQWSYDLDEVDLDVQCLKAGQTLTDTLSVMTLDGTSATITVHVSGENDAPVIMPALADLVAKAGNFFLFEAGGHVLDADRDDLAFTATLADGAALPDWLAFDGATGRFSGTPADKDAGEISVSITAADGHGGLAEDNFDIVIVAQPPTANHAPIVAAAIADQSAIEDVPFEFTLPAGSFKDADGDALQLTATLADGSALPQWLAFDAASGRFSGTPLNADAGKIAILVTASDGTDSVLDVFTLDVANVNDAPTLTQAIADQAGARKSAFSFILPEGLFSDIDAGDALTLSATLDNGDPLPGWLAFDAAAGGFSGIPGVGDTGVHAIIVTATDMAGASASTTFNIAIADLNDAPGGTDKTITFDEGTAHAFSAADFGFGDANGNALKAVVIDAIAGRGALSLDGVAVMAGDEIAVADVGKLAFAPGADEVGADYARISFRVRDDGGTDNGGVDLDPIANVITFAVTDILDVIMGDRSANILDGTEGDDQLSGKGGNDRINAADGMDVLAGGGGRDRLNGGAGEDVLNGGKGRDRLAGGEGVDTFLFRRNGSVDVILDFDAVEDGGHDRLDLAPLKSIRGFDDLMKHHVSGTGADIVIDAGNGDRVILRNVQLSDLDAGDFLF